MDQHVINIIVALIIAGVAAMTKKTASAKNTEPAETTQDPPVLTEADRRYREVQDEIRRKIAQRNQSTPAQPATVQPNQWW